MTPAPTRRGVLPVMAGLPLAVRASARADASDAVLISAEVEVVEAETALAAIFATAFEDTPAEAEADRLSSAVETAFPDIAWWNP